MAEHRLWLDIARARRGGLDLVLVGQAILAQHDRLGAQIAEASARQPWGGDDIGRTFERAYRGSEASLLRVWANAGEYLAGLGAEVTRAVAGSEDADAASARRIGAVG
ncbi:MAG TPA: hypothetical protein VF174_04345 [Micromonosporaceae bacterium]